MDSSNSHLFEIMFTSHSLLLNYTIKVDFLLYKIIDSSCTS